MYELAIDVDAVAKQSRFNNVALYVVGGLGVRRIDCRTLTITPDQKYAQYNDALRIDVLEKGKRKEKAWVMAGEHEKWLRVADLKHAIPVPNPMMPMASTTPDVTVSRAQYSSCDPRWKTDFEDLLAERNVPILLSIGAGARDGEFLQRCKERRP